MAFWNNFFGEADDSTASDYYNDTNEMQHSNANNKVVSINQAKVNHKNGEISLFEPRIYGDAREITNRLLSGQATIINFEQMDPKVAVKTVDFLNGAVFAIDGEIQRIGEQIFLCTPKNFEVSGKTISDISSGKDSL